ncbi:TrkH family potassium uptake protein [Glycomyces arizonensis]|uniref:TrkH family potassium uptake protein n=1 Tax=Glycomyces arizonensis TaxID=256035 RepID=UPI000414BA1F|nr:potassium transporter TrkG [Glycomyces arizonensis]
MLTRFQKFTRHPIRLVPFAFAVFIAVVTVLLMLPIARQGAGRANFTEALFTATSAITVTGLSTVDIPSYWTGFGQVVLLFAMQVGGIGIMTSTAFLGLLVSNKLGLRSKLVTQAELNPTLNLGDLRSIILKTFAIAAVVEAAVSLMLAARFYFGYGFGGASALWQGLFHGVSSFNNAGISLFSDSLMGFRTDWLICGPSMAAAIIGSLGMPVLFELTRRGWGRRKWSLHTKMTLTGTAILFVGGWIVFLVFEWSNPGTIGPLAWYDKLLPALFHSTALRTSGLNSIDVGALHEQSLMVSVVLMFIGGGAAGTAGGIKVTTFFVLLWVIWAEVRAEPDVTAFRKRLSPQVVRQALTVALVYVAFNAAAVVLMEIFEPQLLLEEIMYEVTSAAGTVGQSTGVTPLLSEPSLYLLILLMYGGRIGPVLLATSLAMRTRQRLYRYPEGRPLVG